MVKGKLYVGDTVRIHLPINKRIGKLGKYNNKIAKITKVVGKHSYMLDIDGGRLMWSADSLAVPVV